MTVIQEPLVSLWIRQTLGMMWGMKLAVPAQEKINLNGPLAIPAYLEETYYGGWYRKVAVTI